MTTSETETVSGAGGGREGRERETERERERGERRRRRYLVFMPSRPQRNISELRKTSTKRHTVEMTKKAEIRPEKQSEKAESCLKNL